VLLLEDGFATPGTSDGRLRVVHASPDAPAVAVDVGDDGSFEVASLETFQATEQVGLVVPGGQALPVGVSTFSPRQPVALFQVPAITAGTRGYLVVTGLVQALPSAPEALVVVPLTAAGAGSAVTQSPGVQTFHAVADAPAVDAYVGARRVIAGLAPASLSTPLFVAPGSYTIDLFGADTNGQRPSGAPIASLPSGALALVHRWLFVVSGTADGADAVPLGSVNLEAVTTPSASGAQVRAVNVIPDAGAVDVVVAANGSAPVFDDLGYGEASGSAGTTLAAGTAHLSVRKHGTTDELGHFDVPSVASHTGVLVLHGTLAAPRASLVETTAYPWTVQEIAIGHTP
jgi:hypothetical protein